MRLSDCLVLGYNAKPGMKFCNIPFLRILQLSTNVPQYFSIYINEECNYGSKIFVNFIDFGSNPAGVTHHPMRDYFDLWSSKVQDESI